MKENNSKTDIKTKENKKPDIKIFVSHRIDLDAETIDNPLYVNVRCGAVFDKRENVDMLGDDTGDNISEKRESFNELTVMYWAWKNVDADYYGLCHYRRYFSLSKERYKQDIYSNVVEDYISKNNIEKYKLYDSDYLPELFKNFDVIVTEPYNVSHIAKNLREQYGAYKYLYPEHIDVLLDIIKEKYPKDYHLAKEYIYSDKLIPCSMFIMNKKLFNEYNEFVFDILFECEKRIEINQLSSEGIRVFGHLGERLLGIFINCRQKELRVKYLQRIVFLKTERSDELFPISNNSINIVLSSSDYYVPYLYTTIYSFLQYKEEQDIYDIVILTNNISKNNIVHLKQLEHYKSNIHIRVHNIGYLVKDYEFKANNHVSVETFYRLFIPILFKHYDKIIFLDSDLIIRRNIVDILNECNLEYTINATRDPDYISQFYSIPKVNKYTKKIIKLDNVENYFQAGVLVFNIKHFNQKYFIKELLDFASSREFMYVDQDVMNYFFKDDVHYIDMKWNCMTDCAGQRKENIRLFAPKDIYQLYLDTRKSPYIIHYAGFSKPWDYPWEDFADEFWKVAKKTIFYECILYRMMCKQSEQISFRVVDHVGRIVFPFKLLKKFHKVGYIRQIADKLLPHGTKRRKIVKKLLFR